ncbi:MAG: von Willebrand factor type A domain-containing protein, partial [Phaeodactylibacter sp.]|nr:von Willebrand factor type A domain-containing protein [Phaeodactylibacter sp.]
MRTKSRIFLLSLTTAFFFTSCYRATKDMSGNAKMYEPAMTEEMAIEDMPMVDPEAGEIEPHNTESYDIIKENTFQSPLDHPLSTFSVDVDYASYSNTRRFLMNGNLPPKDAVRIEEFINYFNYDYPAPEGQAPFSIHTEMTACPWQSEHRLVQIGLKGKDIPKEELPPSNLVFLLDVSGSMDAPNKLPLLKSAFKMLVNQLDNDDYVSIVVYAGASGVVLEPTSCDEKSKIINALDQLDAGGSTAGAEGLELAYKLAQEHFRPEANNRILLATDGDFNIGPSSDAQMQRLIESKRDAGIFLSVLGFGMGNYKDSKMEAIADNGNGNYAYI